MKTYREFVSEITSMGHLSYQESMFLRAKYEEYCERERAHEAAMLAAKYLDPYNEAVSLFCEYTLGSSLPTTA